MPNSSPTRVGFVRRLSRRLFGSSGWLLLIALGAALVYATTLTNGFVYDDDSQILENPYVRSFRFIPRIFGSAVFSYTGVASRYYRPVMTFGYLLCFKVFGFSALGFHLVSVLVHAGVVCLVFFVTRRLLGDRTVGIAAAALFALHPIHTESVAWIAAITDVELAFFYLMTFWLFLLLDRVEGRRLFLTYLAMLGSFALALLSKEQAVTLPVLATIYEHFYREGRPGLIWPKRILRYASLWMLAVAYFPLRLSALGGFAVTSNHWELSRAEILLSGIALSGKYLWKLLWPVDLCAFYVFDKSASLGDPAVLAGLGCAVLFACGFYWLWQRHRPVSFGLLWLVITLAPVLNPRWLGSNAFAERYLYLPSVGFCWIAGWGLTVLARRPGMTRPVARLTLIGSLTLLAILCIARIVTRNADWKDDVTFYSRTLEQSPRASSIELNLAQIHRSQGLRKQAEDEFRDAVARDPECAECWNQLGQLYLDEARYQEAIGVLMKAVQLGPAFPQPHVNLAAAYQHTGAPQVAEEQLLTAVALAPGSVRVQLGLGSFWQNQGDYRRAEAAIKTALKIDPYRAQAHFALAELYEADRRPGEAIAEYRSALQADPEYLGATVALRRLAGHE